MGIGSKREECLKRGEVNSLAPPPFETKVLTNRPEALDIVPGTGEREPLRRLLGELKGESICD